MELIGKEVEAVNKKFARVETIKKFRLIDQMLTAEDEELTPTMKLKRGLVEKKYGGLIDGMYGCGLAVTETPAARCAAAGSRKTWQAAQRRR